MPVQISRRGARLIFREHIDRNGPSLSVAFADKAALRTAIQNVINDGDEVIAAGRFRQEQDTTINPIAIFRNEADADAFLTAKGAGFSKRPQGAAADGFAFVITRD
ncbi:MAG: hypothetical protein KAJ55_08925 [Anaerolineales bacterium]|nr:hypothetical protein [Anaerolineales bacterium]